VRLRAVEVCLRRWVRASGWWKRSVRRGLWGLESGFEGRLWGGKRRGSRLLWRGGDGERRLSIEISGKTMRVNKLRVNSWASLAEAAVLIRDGLRPVLPVLDSVLQRLPEGETKDLVRDVRARVLRAVETARLALKHP
jgi:hypothetical protein